MIPKLERTPTLHKVAEHLWVLDAAVHTPPLHDVPWRMTLIRGDGGLIAHSPVPLDDTAWNQIVHEVGEVTRIVAPNQGHHLAMVPFYARCRAQGWAPTLWLAPGLLPKLEERHDATVLPFDTATTFAANAPPLDPSLDWKVLDGVPGIQEVVLFHRPSKTLIVTDAIVNVQTHASRLTRGVFKMISAYGAPKQPVLWKWRAKDKLALCAAVDEVLAWPFERVICAHGEILETGGRAAFDAVFAWARKG